MVTPINQYQPQEQSLLGRNILITGATSGIGRAAAIGFAKQGATVILLGRNIKKLEALYDEIETLNLPQPAIYELNLQKATAQDYTNLAAALAEEFTCLDGLLHNAAELGPRTGINQYSPDAWQQLIQVNLTAPFLLTRALLPLIQKSNAGRIVFTSSSVGRKGRAYWGGYAVTKAGLENLMQVLADELEESPIRVNSINPGATRTAMRATAYPAEDPLTVTPAESLLNSYIYLFGDASAGVHGQQLNAQ